jgi:RNA 2',3'-cyclic 3'-phosphodiesterase
MRCFLALLLDEQVRAYLTRIQAGLAEPGDGIRWVRPENLHLTLQFLGEREERELDGLAEILEEIVERKPLELKLGELALLGSRGRPRVVHVGLCGQVDRLRDLVTEIGEGVELALGLPPEKRAWLPHITLGRVKRTALGLGHRLQARLQENPHRPGLPMPPVTSFFLMQSQLTPSGAVYQRLREFCFS